MNDDFGWTVATNGRLLVVSAPWEESTATGINGDETSNDANRVGAVYAFARSGGAWYQEAYIKASNAGAFDRFGIALAIDGDTLVVGAPEEASLATGVNGDEADNDAYASGAAYVFVRDGSNWSQQAYLKASNTNAADSFGSAVAISGDTIVVGAPGEKSVGAGVGADEGDNSGVGVGAAYVFTRRGSSWMQQEFIKSSNAGNNDDFGASVAIDGDLIAIGAPGEASTSAGVNGNQNNNDAAHAGAAYLFERNAATWSQVAYIKASNPGGQTMFGQSGDRFGGSVALHDGVLVVGAPFESSSSDGIDGDQSNDSALEAGAAYIFEGDGSNWSQVAYVKSDHSQPEDEFGGSVATWGGRVIVGTRFENGAGAGINDLSGYGGLDNAGAAYVYESQAGVWSRRAYLKALNRDLRDFYGSSVAAGPNLVLVGAPGEDSIAAGNLADNSVSSAGAAYAYTFGVGMRYCTPSSVNSTSDWAFLLVDGDVQISENRLSLAAFDLPPNRFATFLVARASNTINPAGSEGTLCVGPAYVALDAARTATDGTLSAEIDVASVAAIGPVLPGDTFYFQCWFRDANPGPTSNFTDAAAVTFE